MRNVGASIAMITNWLFVYVIVLITPIGTFSSHVLIASASSFIQI